VRKGDVIPACAGMTTLALASCFFLTYPLVRWASKRDSHFTGAGFIGTLAGLASVRWLPLDPLRAICVLGGALFVSVAIADRAEELLGHKDDQRIVIDEWLGYLASVVLLPKTLAVCVSAFILFRLADTWKPVGIDRLARLPGGWGVVMDDLAAGLLVNAFLRVLHLS
jgi:phosphatidylglycerophosphatase A